MSEQQRAARTAFRMPAASSLQGLALRVRDPEAALSFYADRLGLAVSGRVGDGVELAPDGRAFTIQLVRAPQAPSRLHPSIGLYHFALLLPDRPALARVIRRLLEGQWPVDGASGGCVAAEDCSTASGKDVAPTRLTAVAPSATAPAALKKFRRFDMVFFLNAPGLGLGRS